MKILIIDDCAEKSESIRDFLCESEFIISSCIKINTNTSDARNTMSNEFFDIVFLDINLPVYPDEEPYQKEGISFLKHLNVNKNIQIPTHIVGITEYSECFEEARSVFNDKMWSLIVYDLFSEDWKQKINDKIQHIYRSKINDNVFDNVDVCIITAVENETRAVRDLPYNWKRISVKNDPTIYYQGEVITADSDKLSIISATTNRMGMVPTAVLSTKIIMNFNPKYLIMVGICAGVKSKSGIGDIIIGDPIWSYEAGKRTVGKDGDICFQPSPHHLNLNENLRERLLDIKLEPTIFNRIYDNYDGQKPRNIPILHVAPVGSGSAVIGDKSVINDITEQHRGILGVEMEGYGLYYSSKMTTLTSPKYILMKSVCDYADEEKNDCYQAYSSYVSCAFLDYFIKNKVGEKIGY